MDRIEKFAVILFGTVVVIGILYAIVASTMGDMILNPGDNYVPPIIHIS